MFQTKKGAKMKQKLFLLLLLLFHQALSASDVKITNIDFADVDRAGNNSKIIATFTVSWNNSWNNERNHDAIWLIFKIKNENADTSWRHIDVLPNSFEFIHNYNSSSPDAAFWVPDDNKGIFVHSKSSHKGRIRWRLKVELELSQVSGINIDENIHGAIHGIEMVYVPEEPFYLGEKDIDAQKGNGAPPA